jgi:3-oxoacyl-[acyl-carrier-protein] synthase II
LDKTLAISGIGLVLPTGCEPEGICDAHRSGLPRFRSRPIFGDHHPPVCQGVVEDGDLLGAMSYRDLKKLDRFTLLAYACALRAMKDAGLVYLADKSGMGLVMGNATGGWEYVEPQLYPLYTAQRPVNPYVATAWFPTASQGEISIREKISGYSKTLSVGELSSGFALEHASRCIRMGRIEIALAGGAESPLSPLIHNSLVKTGRLSGSGRFAALSPEADGLIIGEGAAMVVLETMDRCNLRKGRIYARLSGFGYGRSLEESMDACLTVSGVKPASVDAVFLDAKGDPEMDGLEMVALSRTFGGGNLPVLAAPKILFGNLLGAAFAADVALACLALGEHGMASLKPMQLIPGYSSRVLTRAPECILVNGRDQSGQSLSAMLRK